MLREVHEYVQRRQAEFALISSARQKELDEVARLVKQAVKNQQPISMTFICTHNSRRSHLAQLWAAVAANYYGIKDFQSYSGGTEATAFNPRAVTTLERAGMQVEIKQIQKNPRYLVQFASQGEPQVCFSKIYDSAPNPQEQFIAIMVCSSADESCPLVDGAIARFAIPYEDPKIADGTPAEAAKYDERSTQICREMLYLFSLVRHDP